MATPTVAGIDLFCGAGGLTYGLMKSGIMIVAGVDLDSACEYPFTANNKAPFIKRDIREVKAVELSALYPPGAIRLITGCAPCRPFSSFRRGTDGSKHKDWELLPQFERLVGEIKPELVTMENVPDLASKPIFNRFVKKLKDLKYQVDFRSVYCPRLGIPQQRRRLVLLASLLGPVKVPVGCVNPKKYRTVREAIGSLTELAAGQTDPCDRLHKARAVSPVNLLRLKASVPGGTWNDWPVSLRAPCHSRETGLSFKSVYARMEWDAPSPTITTQSFNFGTGRFGHPQQDRSITLREAALLQTFPRNYRFVKPREPIYMSVVGRLIGNAVPPRLAKAIGKALLKAAGAEASGENSNE